MSDHTVTLSIPQMLAGLATGLTVAGTILWHTFALGGAVADTQSAIKAQAADIQTLRQLVEDEKRARAAEIADRVREGANNRIGLEQRLGERNAQQQLQIDDLKRRLDTVDREAIATARLLARIEAQLDALDRYLSQQGHPKTPRR